MGPKTKPPDELRGGTVMQLLQHYRYRVGDLHRSLPAFTSPSLPHPPTHTHLREGHEEPGGWGTIRCLGYCVSVQGIVTWIPWGLENFRALGTGSERQWGRESGLVFGLSFRESGWR